MTKIQIRVQGGTIQEIQGIPAEYTIEVLDYDIGRRDLPELSTDEKHRMCVVREWPAEKNAGALKDSRKD